MKSKGVWALCVLLVAGAAFSISFWDMPLELYMVSDPWQIRDLAGELTQVGNPTPYYFLSVAGIVIGWINEKRSLTGWARVRMGSLFILMSLMASAAMVHVLKFVVGRSRPYNDGVTPLDFHPFTTNADFQSLPSGHAQVMFTLVGILILFGPRWTWLWLLLGSSIAFTRVILGQHFLSDILVGAALGLIGVQIVRSLWIRHPQQHLFREKDLAS